MPCFYGNSLSLSIIETCKLIHGLYSNGTWKFYFRELRARNERTIIHIIIQLLKNLNIYNSKFVCILFIEIYNFCPICTTRTYIYFIKLQNTGCWYTVTLPLLSTNCLKYFFFIQILHFSFSTAALFKKLRNK